MNPDVAIPVILYVLGLALFIYWELKLHTSEVKQT